MDILKAITVIVVAHAMGCFAVGYYLVLWRTGRDLRNEGSGSLGASNSGRILGRTAYLATGLLDMAKGILAVALARWAGPQEWLACLAGLAVVAGHCWPVQLGFRGGKGIATGYGVVLALAPMVAMAMWAVFIPVRLLSRSSLMAGLLAFIATPFLAFTLHSGLSVGLTFVMLNIVVFLTHRGNLIEELSKRAAPPSPSPETVATPNPQSPP